MIPVSEFPEDEAPPPSPRRHQRPLRRLMGVIAASGVPAAIAAYSIPLLQQAALSNAQAHNLSVAVALAGVATALSALASLRLPHRPWVIIMGCWLLYVTLVTLTLVYVYAGQWLILPV